MAAGAARLEPMTWAVFLDRDGVLVDAPVVEGRPGSPRFARDLVLLPGASGAVRALREAGARVFVVTNQPDVARGSLDRAELDAMHEQLRESLSIDDIRVCPHDGAQACACRKPRPGMILELARDWAVDLAESWTVGDRWVDIAAGAAAGTRTVLVEREWSWAPTSAGTPPAWLSADHRVGDVAEAAGIILEMSGPAAPVP
jgi:D-glycero-D-manno-heptose 1,7-bisphosphate phosphatase